MISELNAKFLEIFNSTDSMDVKQTLVYGFGVFAMFIPVQQYQSSILPHAMNALNSMINSAEAFSDDNVVATESALGAMGKIIYFQRDNVTVTDVVVNDFLTRLPLTHEQEEAQKTHKLFFENVIKVSPNVVNDNTKSNVLKAIEKIREAVANKENDLELVDEEGMSLLSKLQ